ncbi:unnamed protein product [Brassica rapa]|uniref:Uncharacterized protein n=1 Tax=Brassica campestris TaxID=3711 RepID=A0A8D9HJF7_BRACM|nr:unnamed protein product [Brassica rapa]
MLRQRGIWGGGRSERAKKGMNRGIESSLVQASSSYLNDMDLIGFTESQLLSVRKNYLIVLGTHTQSVFCRTSVSKATLATHISIKRLMQWYFCSTSKYLMVKLHIHVDWSLKTLETLPVPTLLRGYAEVELLSISELNEFIITAQPQVVSCGDEQC